MSGIVDLLEIGKPLQFSNAVPNKVIHTIQSQFEALRIEANIIHWTNPPKADPSLATRFTYVMRCDGMSEVDIEIAKDATAPKGNIFVFDPKEWAKQFPEALLEAQLNKPIRESVTGWEGMRLDGTGLLVRFYRKELTNRLGVAVLKRRLDWVFRCERKRMFDDADKPGAPWWLVTRIK